MANRNSQRGGESASSSQYRGVRMRRWGKWVSEIRDPQKKKRIWLGSFRSEAEAAHAFDAAALMCLRNPVAQLNFPDHSYKLPSGSPGHYSTRQIQAAAAAAAAASVGRSFSYHHFMSQSTCTSSSDDDPEELEDITYTEAHHCSHLPLQSHSSSSSSWSTFDDDASLVSEMARGMLIDPPAPSDDDDDDDDADDAADYNHYAHTSLWN